MKRFFLWVGLILVLSPGCSGSSSTPAQGASGVTPADMAGTWNFIPSPSSVIALGVITLNADQTAQVTWPLPTTGAPPLPFLLACYSGTWTVDSQGAGTITAQTNCGAGGSGTVDINFQVSHNLDVFIFTSTSITINLPFGTAVRQ